MKVFRNVLVLLAVAGLTLGTTYTVRNQRIQAFEAFITARGCEKQTIALVSTHPGSKIYQGLYICNGTDLVPIPNVLF